MSADTHWALGEGSKFFENRGEVHRTLRALVEDLGLHDLNYALIGGLAMWHHGFRRFCEIVELLVDCNTLRLIHREFTKSTYVPDVLGSKHLRHITTGVLIRFRITGEKVGIINGRRFDFPSSAEFVVHKGGISLLRLEKLIELKLVVGLSDPSRLSDLADVQELIRHLSLPLEFSQQLDASVRNKFAELWHGLEQDQTQK